MTSSGEGQTDAPETDLEVTPERALAVYGSLLPGETNHHAMLGIDGSWIDGFIYGYLFELTWGPADGYLGVVLDPGGNRIPLKVVVSDNLSSHWRRLDDFEGPGYRRVPVDVYRETKDDTDDSELMGQAYVFEALTDNED